MLQRLTAGSQRYFQNTTPNRLSRHTVMGPWLVRSRRLGKPRHQLNFLFGPRPSLGPAVKREDVQPRRPRTFEPAPAHAVRTGVQSAQIIILSSAPRPRATAPAPRKRPRPAVEPHSCGEAPDGAGHSASPSSSPFVLSEAGLVKVVPI